MDSDNVTASKIGPYFIYFLKQVEVMSARWCDRSFQHWSLHRNVNLNNLQKYLHKS